MKGKIAITRQAEFRSMVVRDLNEGAVNININPNDDMIEVFRFAMHHIKIWLKIRKGHLRKCQIEKKG